MTVTDSYDFGVTSSSFFGEIGIAAGSTIPLVAPTEVVDAQDTAGIAARTAYNDAHRVVLDDGSSVNYWNTQNNAAGQDSPVPWLTKDHTVRVGASVTFDKPVVLDYRFGWKLQPQQQVVGVPTGSSPSSRTVPPHPRPSAATCGWRRSTCSTTSPPLGKDVAGCTAYVDRDDNPIATRSCTAATARAAPGTRPTSRASRPRSSTPSTPWTPTSCRWRSSRTPRASTAPTVTRPSVRW